MSATRHFSPLDRLIIEAQHALGTSLGLRVTAEGVETKEQRAFLERAHCHAWQGYLFSPPVPVAEFEALVRKTNGVDAQDPQDAHGA